MKNKYLIILLAISLFGCSNLNKKSLDVKVFFDSESQLYGLKKGDEILVEPKFINIDSITPCGIAGVADSSGEYYYINIEGQRLNISPFVEEYRPDLFSEGLARFYQDEKIGFISECGEIEIPAVYEIAYPFKNGISIVRKGFKSVERTPEYVQYKEGVFGAIDKTGNLVIPFDFEYIGMFNKSKRASAIKNGEKIVINSEGQIIADKR